MLVGSADGAFTRPLELLSSQTVRESIRWLCFNHVLWQQVPTITDLGTEERFPGFFGTSGKHFVARRWMRRR